MSDSTRGSDAKQIAEWLKILVSPDSTVEMRVLYKSGAPHVRHYASTDLLTMAQDAIRLNKDAKGVYWLLNPLPAEWCGSPAKDGDITRRRWLFIDCDPTRKGTVSSTDAEKEAARSKMIEVDSFLAERRWPAPVIADSGNGAHLLYLIDLPADDGGLVHRVLLALARRFDDEAVTIDTKVGNPSRICKLYGTIASKGDPTPDRPHRVSKIFSIPETLEPVDIGFLNSLVNEDEQTMTQLSVPINNLNRDANCSRPEAIGEATKYLTAMDPSISGANGHDKLLRAASVLVNDFSLTDSEALELLVAEFNPRCEPPWEEVDIRRKIDESKKNPPNRPPKGSADTPASNQRGRPTAMRQKTSSEAIAIRLSDVKEQQVEWLWPNRIPLGKLTLLAGDPGLGKSFVTVDMAARISIGRGWPDCDDPHQQVGSVVMFNCEDDVADTILPRLKRAGGDPCKVIALQGVQTTDLETGERHQRGFSLDADLPKLVAILETNQDVRLVVIDPVSAYCGGTDSHKNADIRAMLAPISDMAAKYRVAVVMVTHLAKGSGGKAVYRAMGSLAFSAAARAVWHVAKDHEDDKRRLILMAKMNVCEEATGLAYRLNDGAVHWEESPVVMTADEHLSQETQTERTPRRESGESTQFVENWLIEKLTECSTHATLMYQMADDADFSRSTLKRAKKVAKVKSHRVGFGKNSIVWWTLSDSENEFNAESLVEASFA